VKGARSALKGGKRVKRGGDSTVKNNGEKCIGARNKKQRSERRERGKGNSLPIYGGKGVGHKDPYHDLDQVEKATTHDVFGPGTQGGKYKRRKKKRRDWKRDRGKS